MTKTSHALKLLATIGSVFLIGYFLKSYISASPQDNDFFEISTELLPIVISISIFVMTWNVYNKTKNNISLFLGAALLVTGIFDIYHLLSYPFMPNFITPNSNQKAEVFWSGSRLISVLLFFVSVFIYKNSFPRFFNKPVLIISANVLNIIFLNTVLLYSEYLPAIHYPDGSFSTTGILLVLLISGATLYTGYLYSIKQKIGQKNLDCLIYGFIILAISNLIYFNYIHSGNLLRAAGYYFIYLALFKLSVEQPYEKEITTEKELRQETEEKYRSIFENATDAIIAIDLADRITSWNLGAESIFGWTAQEAIGKKITQLIVPEDLLTEREIFIHKAKSGIAASGFETVRLRKDDTKIDVSISISPIRDANQNIIGYSSITRDITERKRAEEQIKQSLKEKEVLLREIHHRVKNNMQIISSLLSLQSQFSKDDNVIDMFKESRNRIASMALIHEKLYQSQNFTKIDIKGYIRDLVNSMFRSYDITSKIAVNLYIEDVTLGIQSAIPCGLIINELVTNSIKHAFPDDRKGEIKISLYKADKDEFELVVSDNGMGIPEDMDFRKNESLGLHLVTILAENQLKGEIKLDRSKGTEFRIKFKEEI